MVEHWKLVPVEPTEAMREAGFNAATNLDIYAQNAGETIVVETAISRDVYRAMLAAAPVNARSEGGGAGVNWPYVVQCHRDGLDWSSMAAFENEGSAERYRDDCKVIGSPWQYRVVTMPAPHPSVELVAALRAELDAIKVKANTKNVSEAIRDLAVRTAVKVQFVYPDGDNAAFESAIKANEDSILNTFLILASEYRNRADELEAKLAALAQSGVAASLPTAGAGVKPAHRHLKSGHLVRVIGIGKMQSAKWTYRGRAEEIDGGPLYTEKSVDMREVVIYEHDGNLWARPREEFDDGRFAALAPIEGV